MNPKDEIFKQDIFKSMPFKFNQKVVDVFENTITRSIPAYEEVIRMTIEIFSFHLTSILSKNKDLNEPIIIYDLGSSTGYLLKKLIINLVLNKEFFQRKFSFIGVDDSNSMIKKAKEKCQNLINQKLVSFKKKNLIEFKLPETNSYGVILNYTLQFIPELEKMNLLIKIYKSLKSGGIFILSEKIKIGNKKINHLFFDLYHEFKKRNYYSEEEIKRKEISLQPMIFLQTLDNHKKNLKKAGFNKIEIIHKWYNFVSFMAVK